MLPEKMNCESGLKDASIGMPLLLRWPENFNYKKKQNIDKYFFFTLKRLQRRSVESINQPNNGAVCADENRFSVARKLQSRPVAFLLLVQLKSDERTLVERLKIVQFNALRVDTSRENQSLRVVSGNRSSRQMHHTLAVGRT